MHATHNNIGILFIHGLTGTPSEMKPVAGYLQRLGYRVELPLMAGHGGTIEELMSTNWKDWLASVESAFLKLKSECQQVFLVGMCVSSLISMLVEANTSQVSGLILLSTHFGRYSAGSSKRRFLLPLVYPFPFLRKTLYWTEQPPYGLKDKRMQDRITASIEASKNRESAEFGTFRTYVESLYQARLIYRVAKKRANEVRCPVLAIHSLEDTWFSPENAARVYDAVHSKQKRICYIKGCDHVITVDLQKLAVAQEIEAFVKETTSQEFSFPQKKQLSEPVAPHHFALEEKEKDEHPTPNL